MKNQINALKEIVAKLKAVTDQERDFIGKRAFDKIAELTSQKESLLAQFDEAAKQLDASEISEQLIAEIETIRQKAEENAAILKTVSHGVREARARLKKIREAEFNTGVYGANGAALRNPNASTISAKA